jgi:hypothetical protein
LQNENRDVQRENRNLQRENDALQSSIDILKMMMEMRHMHSSPLTDVAELNLWRMNGCTKCPVCLDTIKDTAMALTCCWNLIHIKCMDGIANHGINRNCPMCRVGDCVSRAIKVQLAPPR